MRCRFEGAFTREERRVIRARLRALDVAIEILGIKQDSHWTVEHVAGTRGGAYVARHQGSEVELWALTPEELERQIAKTVTFLITRCENGNA